MRHVWWCVRAPYLDKAVDVQEDAAFKDVNREATRVFSKENGNFQWHLKAAEKLEMVPGWFVCQTCGHIYRGNYPPPKDWADAIVPDCASEVVRNVQES